MAGMIFQKRASASFVSFLTGWSIGASDYRKGSAFFGLWIICAEGFHRHLLHDLRFHGSVRIIGGSLGDLIYDLHALNDFAEGCISAVQMRTCLMHDKEVWSRKTAYLLDILSFLEFVDNKLTTIFVLNSTE